MTYLVKRAVNLNGQDMTLTPFDIDFQNRVIVLSGEICDENAVVINAALRCLSRDSEDDIVMYIQSPGGSIAAGFSIYDTMQSVNCDVVTVACGMTASMAALILTSGTKGKRWAQPNAEVLIHQPIGGTHGQATDIRIHAEHILKMREKINQVLSDRTGQMVSKIQVDTERDNIFDAQEALAYGLVDLIGDPINEYTRA